MAIIAPQGLLTEWKKKASSALQTMWVNARFCRGPDNFFPTICHTAGADIRANRFGWHPTSFRGMLAVAVIGFSSIAHAANLNAAETYLNNLTTLKANFQQIAPDGSFARGELFLKRPGKMRWNYAPPNAIQMVANDDTLIYYDAEMDEVSYLSLDDTLAAFITQPSIDFDDPELLISRVGDEAGLLRFSVSHQEQPDNGSLMLVFRTEPMQLYQMLVENAGGEVTIITLDHIQQGIPLADALFRFKKPKK